MKNLTKIGLLSFATLAMIVGCGDTYSSKDNCVNNNSLKSLDRTVSFLTDTTGMSLYTFDKDGLNRSNCDAECQKIWPLFRGADTTNDNIKVLESSDQLAYRKHPLYYFVNDTSIGDIKGDNIKNVWHLLYAQTSSNDSQTEFSTDTMTQRYLTDKNGRALYTFDKDTNGTSDCYGTCEDTWPVYYAPSVSTVPTGLNKVDFSTISRDINQSKEGILKQTAYKGKPLYYFTPDAKKSGETKGDWVKGVWHLVEISAKKTSEVIPNLYSAEAVEKGRVIFTSPSKCARCHGVDGQTKPLGVDNIIAKYGDAALITQKLKDMRDNGNPNNRDGAMVSVSSSLSDEAIINLSAFIATLKK
jgi:predicted lipoprotein with Yx(FWY)xxD motif